MRLFGRRRFGVLAFVVLVLAWSSSFSVVKVGLDYAPPVLFAGGRTLLSGVIMSGVALVLGGSPHLRRDWKVFALDRKSTRLNSSHANISYAVFRLKKNHNPLHTHL